MAAPYPSSGGGGEVKCGGGRGRSVSWDFLPGLVVKAPPGPCLQAQRKEKSRNAARSRRGKENLEFFELAKLLPLPGAISSQLDKASIVRLSVTYLRLRRFAALGAPPWGLRAAGPPAGLEASAAEVPPFSRVQERSFFIRMKSTLTKRGLHVKASGYKVIHVTGRLRARSLGLVALGHTLPPAPLAELPLHGHMIVFRLSLGLTILACESRVSDHMDLGPSELVGRSCYQFVHGQDAARIRQSHLDLLDKGQVMTGYYRWLQRAGGFVWLQSVATVAVSGKSPGERHVLWVSYVLSQAEGGQTPLDAFQLPASVACEDASSPEPEPTDGKTEGCGRTNQHPSYLPLPEPEPAVERKQAAPIDKDEAPRSRGKRIKVEPGPGEAKDPEDSGDEEPSSHPALPRPEFTSVIRAGALKQDLVRPWGLGPPGDPPPSLLHAGFLPPVVRGLCTPGTIRYGPAELGLMYPHLQRLGPGPALPEAFYPTLGLSYPGPTGTRVQRKGD
ncbi:neuronal PAS domain-containing protein 1 isoform X4 [Ailuropoda melanoleuca]|uniref:neuronal PAS domain-containing protein 1 isoform X4 n=1 Tax=Ailuropoda melanoleuca TaxID=9646 RepID=UPI001494784C|nr:neuronal PAS domain-containing protein 1 isoform X4 [Ailuropoda melanoleuca]